MKISIKMKEIPVQNNLGRGWVYLGSFYRNGKILFYGLRSATTHCQQGPKITVPLDQLKKQPKH